MNASNRKEMLKLLALQLHFAVRALHSEQQALDEKKLHATFERLAKLPVAKLVKVQIKDNYGQPTLHFKNSDYVKRELDKVENRQRDSHICIPYVNEGTYLQAQHVAKVDAMCQKLREMDMALITADDKMAQKLVAEFNAALAKLK